MHIVVFSQQFYSFKKIYIYDWLQMIMYNFIHYNHVCIFLILFFNIYFYFILLHLLTFYSENALNSKVVSYTLYDIRIIQLKTSILLCILNCFVGLAYSASNYLFVRVCKLLIVISF